MRQSLSQQFQRLRCAASWEWLWIGLIVLIAALVHGFNMFHFPFYESDEGTYIAQAWAVLRLGQLAPYAYWYDHAPLGWIQLAGWSALTGGFYRFGTPIDSGRALMLVLQTASTFLVYRVARRVSESPTAATVAALTFACSAYGIYFHRRVLLDNIATFWMLVSLAILIGGRLTPTRMWLSAFALGFAILSKEVAVVFLPVLAYLAWHHAAGQHRLNMTIGWTGIVGAIVAIYPLMALVRGELFPTDSWLSSPDATESLLGALQYQASRGADGGLLDLQSRFWQNMRFWVVGDPLLVIGGTIAAFVSVARIRARRVAGALGLMCVVFWLFLARGGATFPFYLVPLLPLLAINLGLLVDLGIQRIHMRMASPDQPAPRRALPLRPGLVALVLVGTLAGYTNPNLGLDDNPFSFWTNRQADVQAEAIAWVREHIDPESRIIIDQSMWVDLHEPPATGSAYANAHYYWKIPFDDEIRDGVFENDWRTVNYIVTTRQLVQDTQEQNFDIVAEALAHSQPVASFDVSGWPIEIRHVHPSYPPVSLDTILAETWSSYKERFIADGRVIDPSANGQTTSEGQSYAMLKAVYMNDRPTFDQVWAWTQAHLQVRNDALPAWQWGTLADGTEGLIDASSATDATQDIALALLFAARQWDTPRYHEEALAMLADLWTYETVMVAGQRVVVAGDWVNVDDDPNPVINPSYFAPYAYRIFAEADPQRPWMELVDSSYAVLARIQADPQFGQTTGLVPNWIALDARTGEPLPASGFGPYADEFSYDASRTPWRIALDWAWFGDERAMVCIARFGFLWQQLEQHGQLAAAYRLDGTPNNDLEAVSMYAGVVPALLIGGDREVAYNVFADKILGAYVDNAQAVYWGDPDNYYNQNWAWFTTAVMNNTLTNLWADAPPGATPVATLSAVE